MSESSGRVSIEEVPDTIQAGEAMAVTIEFELPRDAAEDIPVELLDFDGDVVDTADVSPPADDEDEEGASETIELEWTPGAKDVGTSRITVRAGASTTEADVTVEDAPAAFEIEITTAPEYVAVGSTVAIECTVENTGTLAGTQDVDVAVVDLEENSISGVSLEGGESEHIQFDFRVDGVGADVEELEVTISSEDDSDTVSIVVLLPTVSPVRPVQSKSGMGLFGWVMFFGMIILLIPLLPVIVVLKVLEWVFGPSLPTR